MENTNATTNQYKEVSTPVEVNLKSLLQVGGHFGTKTSAWNPKCAPFIYGVRNGVYIINLDQTLDYWSRARDVIVSHVTNGGSVLFVGTKKQSSTAVTNHAQRCGEPYVNFKWNAGTLTNFNILRRSVAKMEKYEQILKDSEGGETPYTKKELVLYQRLVDKMLKRFGGLRNMKSLPSLIFITDARNESIAVDEAIRVGVPTVSLADTDCKPEKLTHIIPANDDAVRTLELFCAAVADAVLEGKDNRKTAAEIESNLPPVVEEPVVETKVETKVEVKTKVKKPLTRQPHRDKNLRVEIKKF